MKATKGTLRAYGYVRLSRLDKETTSPRRQREIIADLCKARGWKLVEVFEDLDVSGGKESRPGLDAMMARLADCDVVICWKLDRLARSLSHLLKLAEWFEGANVQLVTSDGEVDTVSAGGRAFFQMRGVFAEFERRTMSERTKAMHAFLKAQGRVQSKPPFGWRKGADGTFEEVPEEQVELRQMAQAYADGASLRQLARQHRKEHTTIRVILRNPRTLEALPSDLADALRQRLRIGADKKMVTRSLLAGVTRCGVCGGPMKRFGRSGGVYGCRAAGHVYIGERWLDLWVGHVLITAGAEEELQQPVKRTADKDNGAEARLEKLEQDYYERGIVSESSFMKRREALLNQIAAAQTEPAPPPRPSAATWDKMTVQQRRAVVMGWIEQIVIQPVPAGSPRGVHDPRRVQIDPQKGVNFRALAEGR